MNRIEKLEILVRVVDELKRQILLCLENLLAIEAEVKAGKRKPGSDLEAAEAALLNDLRADLKLHWAEMEKTLDE